MGFTGDNLSFYVEGLWVTRPILGIERSISLISRSICESRLGTKINLEISLGEKTPSSEVDGVS